MDKGGNLFIADTGNHRIRKVGLTGSIVTIAGAGNYGYTGDGGPAALATLFLPHGMAVDETGNFYIADSWNHCVRRVGVDGNILTIAGTGSAGFSGNGQLATNAQLNFPGGVEVGPAGSLFIADTGNNQVRRIFPGDPSQPPAAAANVWMMPSSARARGLNGAFFTAELMATNTGSQDANLRLQFLDNNQDGRNGIQKTLTVAAGKSAVFSDVLGTLFGVTDGYGAIRVTSASGALAIESQTSTRSLNGGSYGQSVPAMRHEEWIVHGMPRTLVGIREDSQFRTNLIVTNATEELIEADVRPR